MIDYRDIEIRSEEVQDILGTPPRWMVRWGTSLSIISVLLLAFCAWLIKYPETFRKKIVITTTLPSVPVGIDQDMAINTYLVEASQQIGDSDPIAIINTDASYEDIKATFDELEKLLNSPLSYNRLNAFRLNKTRNLGELQPGYLKLIKLYDQSFSIKKGNEDALNKEKIDAQILKIKENIVILQRKHNTAVQELEVAQQSFQTQKQLYSDHKTTLTALQNARAVELEKDQNLKSIIQQIVQKENDILQAEKEKLKLQKTTRSNTNYNLVELKAAINNFYFDLDSWKKKHILRSPIEGMIEYPENGFKTKLMKGDTMLFVAPSNPAEQKVIGKIIMLKSEVNRIVPGQRVVIQMDGYPPIEYGSVEGKVSSNSIRKKEGKREVDIILPEPLETNHKKMVKFEQGMTGQAEIIVGEKSVLEKLFENLLQFFGR